MWEELSIGLSYVYYFFFFTNSIINHMSSGGVLSETLDLVIQCCLAPDVLGTITSPAGV